MMSLYLVFLRNNIIFNKRNILRINFVSIDKGKTLSINLKFFIYLKLYSDEITSIELFLNAFLYEMMKGHEIKKSPIRSVLNTKVFISSKNLY